MNPTRRTSRAADTEEMEVVRERKAPAWRGNVGAIVTVLVVVISAIFTNVITTTQYGERIAAISAATVENRTSIAQGLIEANKRIDALQSTLNTLPTKSDIQRLQSQVDFLVAREMRKVGNE